MHYCLIWIVIKVLFCGETDLGKSSSRNASHWQFCYHRGISCCWHHVFKKTLQNEFWRCSPSMYSVLGTKDGFETAFLFGKLSWKGNRKLLEIYIFFYAMRVMGCIFGVFEKELRSAIGMLQHWTMPGLVMDLWMLSSIY